MRYLRHVTLVKTILCNNLKKKFKRSTTKIEIGNFWNMMVDALGSLNGYTEERFFFNKEEYQLI